MAACQKKLLVLACAVLSATGAIRKCCPVGQQVGPDFTSCVEFAREEVKLLRLKEEDPFAEWLPDTAEFLSADTLMPIEMRDLSTLTVEYGRQPCPLHEAEIIHPDEVSILNNGTLIIYHDESNSSYPESAYCVDSFASEYHVLLLCPCLQQLCVRKCCPEDDVLEFSDRPSTNTAECSPTNSSRQWVPTFRKATYQPYFKLHGTPKCKHGQFPIHPKADIKTEFLLESDGSLIVEGKHIITSDYCGEFSKVDGKLVEIIMTCRKESLKTIKIRQIIFGILFIVGAVFLMATLLIHIMCPELRKTVHARSLIAHTACLLVGYITTAISTFGLIFPCTNSLPCILLALLIQYSFLTAFLWLNVMCIDIAWVFSGLRVPRGNSILESDTKKFFYYSVYVWSVGCLITLVTVFIEFTPGIPASVLKPNIGLKRCFLDDQWAIVIYCYGPLAISLAANSILFTYTSTKIIITRRDTNNVLKDGNSRRHKGKAKASMYETHRFFLYLKLFCLMGITWVFEVITWVVDVPTTIWFTTDVINSVRAILIFIIFCCKRKVYNILRAKFFNLGPTGKNQISRTSKDSQRTNSLQLSDTPSNTNVRY